nr:hypothetical protein [Tanacetum cinerariifolium]
MTDAAITALISRGVADALLSKKFKETITSMAMEAKVLEVVLQDMRALLVSALTLAFLNELALLCERMFPEESDKVEKYVGGLPDMIHGSVMTFRPKTMHDVIEFATELMDKKIRTLAERQAENKRTSYNNNQDQQQLPKRQNVAQAYTAMTGERKEYAKTLSLYNKCKFYHNGPCTAKIITCYGYGNQGHYKSDYPELKNRNHGNQAEGTEARRMVYALGGGETDQDPNNIEDEIKS